MKLVGHFILPHGAQSDCMKSTLRRALLMKIPEEIKCFENEPEVTIENAQNFLEEAVEKADKSEQWSCPNYGCHTFPPKKYRQVKDPDNLDGKKRSVYKLHQEKCPFKPQEILETEKVD